MNDLIQHMRLLIDQATSERFRRDEGWEFRFVVDASMRDALNTTTMVGGIPIVAVDRCATGPVALEARKGRGPWIITGDSFVLRGILVWRIDPDSVVDPTIQTWPVYLRDDRLIWIDMFLTPIQQYLDGRFLPSPLLNCVRIPVLPRPPLGIAADNGYPMPIRTMEFALIGRFDGIPMYIRRK